MAVAAVLLGIVFVLLVLRAKTLGVSPEVRRYEDDEQMRAVSAPTASRGRAGEAKRKSGLPA